MTVSILLVVLFSVLWFVDYENSTREVRTALNTVLELNKYDLTIPTTRPDGSELDIDDYEEDRSLYSRVVLFSVSKDGVIDYQKMYDDYPYLTEYGDIEGVVEKTISSLNEGKDRFVFNGRSYHVNRGEHAGQMDYVFFDWTLERVIAVRSVVWYFFAFIFAILSVGLLAYVHSDRVLYPVKKGLKNGRDFISNASHELKTPLTIMNANISVLKSDPNSTVQENEKWINAIEEQIKRSNALIMDMLELSKLEDHKLDLTDKIDLSHLTNATILSVEALCFEKALNVSETVQDGLLINGNKQSIERLLLILIDNAIKYTPYAGELQISLSKIKKNIVLSVKNSGPGINKEDIPYIFERFYKGDRARTQHSNEKSFGLGLAMAKSITNHHGGKIECFSDNNLTEFKVTFKQNIIVS